jgi:uncharacterized protein YggE
MMARHGMRFEVDRLERLDAVLQALAQAGVDGIPLVEFRTSDDADARSSATEQAVRKARAQAEAIARAAGGRLGELLRINTAPEFAYGLEPANRVFSFPGAMDQGVMLVPSELTVRIAVQAAWRYVER